MARIKIKPEYREIVKLFSDLTGSKSLWEVFNDCIEMFAIAMQNIFALHIQYEKNERRYNEIIKRYKKEEVETIVEILSVLTIMAEENPFQDLLGDLYMQLDMGSSALGQFFTPYSVSCAMAQCCINIDEVKKEIDSKGYVTINEPCCGGGANIISACEVLHKNGINYQNQCVIVGQDLNRLTAMMCYVVLSILGCSAVIKVRDTLADPFTNYKDELKKGSEIWTTPMFHINNCYNKC